jgi:hypothetical protein
MNFKDFGCTWSSSNFKVLTLHSPGGADENYVSPRSGLQVTGPRIEPGTS